jgi:hypothetical protein
VADPLLRLEPDRVSVEPGGQASVQVTVHNPGTIVDSYRLDVVGEQPIDWAEVVPATVSVYPQQQETVTVLFRPPTGPGTPGGLVPFGVRATSEVDASARSVAEGELTIGQVSGLQAKLTPVTSSGRWRGRHTVQISNWGNSPARLRLVPTDPDQALGFLIRPDIVEIPLGATATARLKVRTRKPILRGTTTRLPFQVVGEPDPPVPVSGPVTPYADPSRPVVDGALNQTPILSRMTVSIGVLSVAAVVAAIVFALTRGAGEAEAHGDGVTVPGKPQLGQVQVTGPTTMTVSWDPMDNIDSFTLHYYLGGKAFQTEDGINARQQAKQVDKLKPNTEYCFSLSAKNGNKLGPESDQQCAKTPLAPPPTASPSAGPGGQPSQPGQLGQTGQPSQAVTPTDGGASQTRSVSVPPGPDSPVFAPGQWVAVVELYPTDAGISAETHARDLARQLASAGVPSGVLRARGQYPGLTNQAGQPLNNAWVVYVGPGPNPDQVQGPCTDKAPKIDPTALCAPRQPATG